MTVRIKIILILFFINAGIVTVGQRQTLEFSFTAIDQGDYVVLDSVKIMNRTQGTQTVISFPDTTTLMEINPGDMLLYVGYAAFPVGIKEMSQQGEQFQIIHHYPNPVRDQSLVSVYLPEKGTVTFMITDMKGSVNFISDWLLGKGNHSFRFIPGDGNLFVLTAYWNGLKRSIKMFTTEQHNGKKCSLLYSGSSNSDKVLKTLSSCEDEITEESGIVDFPETSKTYTFQFASNMPCPGIPIVEYEGRVYNTVQIYSQCWLKENLNVGSMIAGGLDMTDNGIIEKYCYDNEIDNCTNYGGLYQWDEMMQYTTQQVSQGICPPGWHLPMVEEWRILDAVADTYFGIGDPEWDHAWGSGWNAGNHLKTDTFWGNNCICIDKLGFSGMPGGLGGNHFVEAGNCAFWWSSTEKYDDVPWGHELYCFLNEAFLVLYGKGAGFSVRCIKDE